MTAHQQHHLHGTAEGGYLHTSEQGCPPKGKAFYDALFVDVVEYDLATVEEAEQARNILGEHGFETYYHLRGAANRKGHEAAIQGIRRLGPGLRPEDYDLF